MIEKILERARAEMFDLKLHKSSFHKGFNDGVHTVMKIVQEVAKDGGWIPCSERLPSDCAIHEVTAQFSNGKRYTEFAYYDESKEEWWKFDDDGTVNVIAWKEGSAPYQKGE